MRRVTYRQNIGLVVLWWRSSTSGAFCGTCRRRLFWTATGVTATLGWWGILSFFVSAVVLVGNIAQHVGAGRGDRAPRGGPCWRCGGRELGRLPVPGALRVATGMALVFGALAVALEINGVPVAAALVGGLAAVTLTALGVLLARPVAACATCGNRQPV